jgi:hypothetical protein
MGHVACIREMTNAYKILVRKPDKKRPLGRPRHRREDNIKNLHKMVFKGVTWIHWAQERIQRQVPVNMVKKSQVA